MNLNPKAKMCPGKNIEKRIVREAFADMLPESVAWRQKEQFSDGVGYSWIDTLREITATAVSDEQMKHAAERFPINTPQKTKKSTTIVAFSKSISPVKARPGASQRAQCGMLHRRSADMGRLFPRKERPQRTSSSGGTRRSIQGLKKSCRQISCQQLFSFFIYQILSD